MPARPGHESARRCNELHGDAPAAAGGVTPLATACGDKWQNHGRDHDKGEQAEQQPHRILAAKEAHSSPFPHDLYYRPRRGMEQMATLAPVVQLAPKRK